MDLRELLEHWPYEAENNVRVIKGRDGRDLLQVRLPLGLEQYELEGRPDGRTPMGQESLMDYHLSRLNQAKIRGDAETFSLSEEECAELFNEGMLYYYRYLHLFQIQDWSRTIRDTNRNLRLFDLVHRYAVREDDRNHLEQWRPYIVRMNSIAAAMIDWENRRYDQALACIQVAIDRIEALSEKPNETYMYERQRSLVALRELVNQFEKNRPLSELQRLERDLRGAIDTQEFERAAELRDRIRAMRAKANP